MGITTFIKKRKEDYKKIQENLDKISQDRIKRQEQLANRLEQKAKIQERIYKAKKRIQKTQSPIFKNLQNFANPTMQKPKTRIKDIDFGPNIFDKPTKKKKPYNKLI